MTYSGSPLATPEALALAHSEVMNAVMLGDLLAADRHQISVRGFARPALFAQIGIHERRIVAVGDEADFEALALVGDGQVHLAGDIRALRA